MQIKRLNYLGADCQKEKEKKPSRSSKEKTKPTGPNYIWIRPIEEDLFNSFSPHFFFFVVVVLPEWLLHKMLALSQFSLSDNPVFWVIFCLGSPPKNVLWWDSYRPTRCRWLIASDAGGEEENHRAELDFNVWCRLPTFCQAFFLKKYFAASETDQGNLGQAVLTIFNFSY